MVAINDVCVRNCVLEISCWKQVNGNKNWMKRRKRCLKKSLGHVWMNRNRNSCMTKMREMTHSVSINMISSWYERHLHESMIGKGEPNQWDKLFWQENCIDEHLETLETHSLAVLFSFIFVYQSVGLILYWTHLTVIVGSHHLSRLTSLFICQMFSCFSCAHSTFGCSLAVSLRNCQFGWIIQNYYCSRANGCECITHWWWTKYKCKTEKNQRKLIRLHRIAIAAKSTA